jgi:hypothetical protein
MGHFVEGALEDDINIRKVEKVDKEIETDAQPLRSASPARRVTEIGTKTAFSGFGKTPTGELRNLSRVDNTDTGRNT